MIKRKTNKTEVEKPVTLSSEWFKKEPCRDECCSFFGKGVCSENCKIEPELVSEESE